MNWSRMDFKPQTFGYQFLVSNHCQYVDYQFNKLPNLYFFDIYLLLKIDDNDRCQQYIT